MRLRFILGLLILLLACALQFWFAASDVFVNFILAALIVFAFFFDIGELTVYILAAVFIVNWQPAPSVAIIVFALIPVGAFVFRKMLAITPWVAAFAALVAGFAVLYLAVAPFAFLAHWQLFSVDIFGGLVFGGTVFATLERLRRT
jgi:hypothetical protein